MGEEFTTDHDRLVKLEVKVSALESWKPEVTAQLERMEERINTKIDTSNLRMEEHMNTRLDEIQSELRGVAVGIRDELQKALASLKAALPQWAYVGFAVLIGLLGVLVGLLKAGVRLW